MRNLRLLLLVNLTVILIVTVLFGACAAQPAATPTPTAPATTTPAPVQTIKIGAGHPLTGPYTTICQPIFNGFKDYFSYINDVDGGLKAGGKTYKFEIIWGDTKGDIPTGLATYKRFAEEGVVAFGQSVIAEGIAQITASHELKVPILGSGGSDDQAKNNELAYMYCFEPPYQLSNTTGIKWYKDNIWKGTGKMKLARLYVDYATGKVMDVPAVNELLLDMGCELSPIEWFPNGITDFTPYLLRIRDTHPDLIFCQMVTDPYALCLKDATRLGIDVTKPQFMSQGWGGTNSQFLQASGKASEGSMSVFYWKWWWNILDTSATPQFQKLLNIPEKYQNTRRPPETYAKGLSQAIALKTAIERAIQNAGTVTKETVQSELSKFKNVDVLCLPPATFADCQRYGGLTSGVLTVKDGTYKILADYTLPPVPGAQQKLGYYWKGGCK